MIFSKLMMRGLFAVALFFFSFALYGSDDETFTGEIADSQCAMNVHSLDGSHKEMLKVKSVGKNNADCTVYCVKNRGGRYMLQSKKKTYRLDNQELPESFAGRKVRVIGTLDPKTDTIQVRTIEPIS